VHANQVVADMADEVLARQAAVRTRWSGESFGDALEAVVRTEAGRQLQELRDGPHGSERAVEWQENLVHSRAEEPGVTGWPSTQWGMNVRSGLGLPYRRGIPSSG
jgi:hypothetical protein